MQLELTFMDNFCHVDCFEINGIEADTDDFGDQCDNLGCQKKSDLEVDKYQGCLNMTFKRKEISDTEIAEDILTKYHINEDEYIQICKSLEKGLSFGCCGLCI